MLQKQPGWLSQRRSEQGHSQGERQLDAQLPDTGADPDVTGHTGGQPGAKG